MTFCGLVVSSSCNIWCSTVASLSGSLNGLGDVRQSSRSSVQARRGSGCHNGNFTFLRRAREREGEGKGGGAGKFVSN